MPEAAAWVLVALAAVLVGFAVPVLLQLRKTLQTAEKTLQSTGSRLNEVLDGVTVTLTRVNDAASELEGGVRRVSSLLSALGSIGDALGKVRTSFAAVSSLGSILGGALLGALGFGHKEHADEPVPANAEAEEVKTP
jgi:uncharacterized protein YoxC